MHFLSKKQKLTLAIQPLIREFAIKYGTDARRNGLLNLQRILANRQYKVSLDEVKDLVSKEVEIIKQHEEQKQELSWWQERWNSKRSVMIAKQDQERKEQNKSALEQKLIKKQQLIKQFAKKYGTKASNSDLVDLQMLLSKYKYEVSPEELEDLVRKEFENQQIENLKSKVFKQTISSRVDILKSYLNFYQSEDETNLRILAVILEEKYFSSENISYLKIEIKEIEKKIRLENFEKRLFEGNEQINLEGVDQQNGYEFEDFLKTLFYKMGYQVEQTKLSGDQGADLVVVKFNEKTVIQAKRFGGKVGNKAVQEIFAAMSFYRAHKGMVITNNYFTPAAFELADANNIELIDRDTLEELINKHW